MEDGRVLAVGHTEDSPKDNVQQVESNKPVADNDGNDGYFGEAWSSKPEGTRHLGSNNAHGSFGADMSPPVVESALIEVSSDSDLKKEVIMAIPNEEGTGYIREVIRVEYEWKPPHCVACKRFGHGPTTCPNQIKLRKETENGSTQHQQINGIKLSKPTPNFQYRPAPKLGKDMGDASNVGAKDQNEGATSQSSFAKTFVVEDLNLKNSFEALKDSNNIFEAQESRKQSSMGTDDLESDDEVDEVLFPEGNKFGDQFDIRLKGHVWK
ncbi:hypothetical protein Tco_1219294 [Tanacetum coccineum]